MAKVFIEETTLTSIGDAIRGKEGTAELIPVTEMATRISAIQGGGSGGGNEPTAEELTFTGNLSGVFSNNNWNWFLEKYKNKITAKNVSSIQNIFANSSNLEDLSWLTISVNNNTNPQSMFSGCSKLKKLPKVIGALDRYLYSLFSNCFVISGEEINNFFTNLTIYPASSSTSYASIFSYCHSVRDLTAALEWLHTNLNTYTGNSTSFVSYNYWLQSCFALATIENMPVLYSSTGARTSNAFSYTFDKCSRAKDVIFKTNNGTPYVVQWKGQTIDLSNYVGYLYASDEATLRNYTDFTVATRVLDDATYQERKNNSDWFAVKPEYSRYNHDSAVNTINSLPDTSAYLASAGGTNTIKFKGVAGSNTDGGAINTLTAEEIAVATAKGWTVTLV